MKRSRGWLGAAALLVVTSGCSDGPTAPDQVPVDFELASFDLMGDGYGYGADGMGAFGGVRHGPPGLPLMGRLLAQARAMMVAEQGREAAQAMFAALDALRREAHAARRASDRALFREKIEAAHAEAARLIVEILGAPRAQELVDLAKTKLIALEALIAELQATGALVPRLERASERAGELVAAAEASLAAGEIVEAMIKAGRAAQLAHVALHHGSVTGGG